MNRHRGSVVEEIVRRSGYSIKALADKLNISRNTVYNRFKEHDLSYEFIAQVSHAIHYDFNTEFPELKTTVPLNSSYHLADIWRLEKKYTRLLERHNRLLSFLIRTSNEYHMYGLKKEIEKFLEKIS